MRYNATDRKLLIALREGNHGKGNPGFPRELVDADWPEVDASGRRLREWGLVKSTPSDEKPGSPCYRLTDIGMSEADILLEMRSLETANSATPERSPTNWTKVGAIAAALAIPTMILLWWFQN